MVTHEQEINRVREWNRELLLKILETDSLPDEKQNPAMNLKSQMLIRAALNAADVLYRVSYKDKEPTGSTYDHHRANQKRALLRRFQEFAEVEYNFIAARKVLIRVIRELHMEQEYDLLFLKRFDLGSVRDDDCYSISRADKWACPSTTITPEERR